MFGICKAQKFIGGKWTYGYYFKCWEDEYLLWGMTNGFPNKIRIKPETVCRYTGLDDKNKNNIFENDILSDGVVKFKVYYRDGAYYVTGIEYGKGKLLASLLEDSRSKYKIIGNVLEGGKNNG